MISTSSQHVDIAIIGAGAAGLTAAIFAAGAALGRGLSIVLVDGAARPGAKILVSGGGRCNVTNERLSAADYCGGPPTIIRKVIRAFDQRSTLEWMRGLGVPLKLEETGKYFPESDQARSVLDALLGRAGELGVHLLTSARVKDLRPAGDGYALALEHDGGRETLLARRVILATGGCSLPKSGSDGQGLAFARRLGHTIVPTTPALSPLVLRPDGSPGGRFAELSGLTLEARLGLYHPSGKRLAECSGSLLFTHFGLSGPAALDISRHYLRARLERPDEACWLGLGHPELPNPEKADAWLRGQIETNPRLAVNRVLSELYPQRLARLLAEGLDSLGRLTRAQRLALACSLSRLPLPVTGDRGYAFAEVTAGGVDLREIDPATMASRKAGGLFLCGEMLDADGRIGGFNFQWAWATGYLAGRGSVASLA